LHGNDCIDENFLDLDSTKIAVLQQTVNENCSNAPSRLTIEKLKKELEAAVKELKTAKEQVEGCESDKSEFQTKINKVTTELTAVKTDHKHQIDNLKKVHDQLTSLLNEEKRELGINLELKLKEIGGLNEKLAQKDFVINNQTAEIENVNGKLKLCKGM
jgi:chromosome segregation ATPase